jgi:hypothetical protein
MRKFFVLAAVAGLAMVMPITASAATHPATVIARGRLAPGSCSPWRLQKKFPPAWGIVGATYVQPGAAHVRQSFTYRRGQSSSIGEYLSVNGGTFAAHGATAVKAAASIAFPSSARPGNNVFRTRFQMGDYKRACASNGSTVTSDLLKATGFAGGKNVQHPATAPAASTCQPLLKGDTFTRDKGKAFTWPDGMTVNRVKISMQTGYDSSAQVTYKSGASRQVCGISGHGPASSPLVVVKP